MRSLTSLIVLAIFAFASAARADDKAAAAWLAKTVKKAGTPQGSIRHVAFVQGLGTDGLPKFEPIDAAAFDELSWFRTVSPADAALTMKLNARPAIKADGPAAAAQIALSILPVDAVVLTTGAEWELISRAGSIARGHAPAGRGAGACLGWLRGALGHDGLVLAVDGPLVLIGSGVSDLETHRQAVVLGPDGKTAVAIVERVAAEGPFGAFRRVLTREGGDAGIRPGAKVAHGAGR